MLAIAAAFDHMGRMTKTQQEARIPPDRQARQQSIAEALAGAPDERHHVPFREGYLETPVVAVDPSLLVYRADNGRLFAELVARGEPREQREGGEQQNLLHALLVEKARDPDGPIFRELERHAVQTEPLLVTSDGLVVNGNRRLATMRELRARDPDHYGAFSRISVAVLPDHLDRSDIEYIEAALQMAPELKLAYSWVNRRLTLRDHVQRHGAEDDVVAAYRFADREAMEAELAELALAERYLEYLGHPGDFERVSDLEEAFKSMVRELGEITNPTITGLWNFAGFAMLAESAEIKRRADQYFPFDRPVPFALVHWAMRTFAEEEGLAEPQQPGENRPVDRELARKLEPILSDRSKAAHVAMRITILGDRLRANQDEEIGGAQTLSFLRRARQNLDALDLAALARPQAQDIRAELLLLAEYSRAIKPQSDVVAEAPDIEKSSPLSRLFGR